MPAIQSKYKLTSIKLVKEKGSKYHIEAKINPEKYKPSKELEAEVVDHIASNGKVIPCVLKGSVKIPVDRVSIYPMGKVPIYPKEELRQLQKLKQNDRKKFDAEPKNEERLVVCQYQFDGS